MKYGFLTAVGLLGCSVATTVYEPPPNPTPNNVTPVFNGEAQQASTAPKPVSGGTVRIVKSGDGAYAVVADPEEDAIDVIALGASPSLVGQIALSPGDEPNRMAVDNAGLVHVVLRGGGAIATIDPASASLVARRNVCPAPRGIDYDASLDTLYVACATGELVSIGSTGPVTRIVRLERDLRDVVVTGNDLVVTKFRAAERLHIDGSGKIVSRQKTQSIQDAAHQGMASVVAWRTLSDGQGGTIMLHQLASTVPLVVAPSQTYYASTGSPISASAVSIESDGDSPEVLDVEVAIDATINESGTSEILSLLGDVQLGPNGQIIKLGSTSTSFTSVDNHYQFVAIDDGGRIGVPFKVVQQRAPFAQLQIFDAHFKSVGPAVVFPQKTTHLDTGFDIFHIPTFVGTACMSCHPEGGDDGHTWQFTVGKDTEVRRTQSLRGGVITGSAPYHWNGDLADLGTLCDEVFTHRMGGGKVLPQQEGILAHWMNAIPRTPTRNDLDAAQLQAGKALFEGTAGCTSCHTGASSVAANMDIGKVDALGQSRSMQVPALLDVADRAPYMHDGCATTLMDRFTNVTCGGTNHGNTASLGAADLGNLTTYLESL